MKPFKRLKYKLEDFWYENEDIITFWILVVGWMFLGFIFGAATIILI